MEMEKSKAVSVEQIMVSVLCATYNHEKYIERALKGFLSQITDFRFEVIVHEDASTDGTRKILEKYAKSYPDIIKPIYQDVNQYSQGRGRTFRNMISQARGKYVAICEGDDFWIDEYKLQKQYEALENNKDCSICIHKVQPVFEDIDLVEKPNERAKGTRNKYYLQSGVIEKDKMASALWLEGGYPAQTSSYFMRKEALEPRITNEEEFLHCMSGDLSNLRLCLKAGKFYRIDEFMSCRRRGVEGSWSARWAAFTPEAKVKHYTELARGELLFDKYSDYEFHEYIQIHVVNILAECCIYNPRSIKEFKDQVHLSCKVIHNKETLWLYIRYCIMRVCPSFYKFLFEIQKKILEGKQK